jgi:hypothetical protein
MMNWLLSLRGAVTLSVIALLMFLARWLGLDALIVLPHEIGVREDQVLTVAQIMSFTVAFFGVWIWALLAAVQGSRAGIVVALIFSLLAALFSGASVAFLCRPGCAARPLGDIIVWAGLITGLAASVALGAQLGRSGTRSAQFQRMS